MTLPTLPYPSDWQSRKEYLADRIARLKHALWFCKGRAADVRPLVLAEIARLENLLLFKR
jgi:hypothetical protein